MSDINNNVTLTLGYSNTESTRTWKIDGLSAAALPQIKSKILAINASLAGGTDGGLGDFFRSDDYDASNPNLIVGKFTGIVAAKAESTEVENIPLN